MQTFDVAISFAGEDRQTARRIAKKLKNNGLSVFFDEYFEDELLAKQLYTYLQDIYKNRATFFLCLLSDNYIKKPWTRKELESAQERALFLEREYIIPIYVDKYIEVPGIPETVGYKSLSKNSIKSITDIITKKVNKFYAENELNNEIGLFCNKILEHYSFIVRHVCCYGLTSKVAEGQMIIEIIDAYRTAVSRYAHKLHEQLYDFIFNSLDNINKYLNGDELSLYSSLNIQREYGILLKLFDEWKKHHYDRDYDFFPFVEKMEDNSNIEERIKSDLDTVVKYLEDNENSPTTFEIYMIELTKLTFFDKDISDTVDFIKYLMPNLNKENSYEEAKQAFDSSPLIGEIS